MKTKKLKKRSFVGAIALLVISAITLTTSTFAWFSMGQDAKIETMELTVSSPDGFEISANADTWTQVLTPEEIFKLGDADDANYESLVADASAPNYYPAELKPVSCAFNGGTDFFSAKYASRLTEGPIAQTQPGEATYEGEITVADNAGFVAFDLYIKSGGTTAKNLYFDKSEFAYNADNEDHVENKYATSALRVAFANLGNINNMNASASEARALNAYAGATVYEPDSLTRANGTTGTAQTTQYVTSAGTGLSVDDANKVFTSNVAASSADTLVTDQSAKDQLFITVQPGVTKLRVFIWVEGNDIDCRDSIGSDNLKAVFRFQQDQNADFSLDG